MATRRNLRCILLMVVVCLIVGIEGGRGRISLKRASRVGKGGGAKGGTPSNIKDTTSEPDHGSSDDENDGGDDEGDEASAFGMLKCHGQDMKMTEAQMNHMKECAAAIGVKDKKEMTMEKFPCFSKCIFEHKKLVDEKGMPHKENIMGIFTDAMPDSVKQSLSKAVEKCLDEHGGKVKPAEELCDSYADLGICIQAAYMLACKP